MNDWFASLPQVMATVMASVATMDVWKQRSNLMLLTTTTMQLLRTFKYSGSLNESKSYIWCTCHHDEVTARTAAETIWSSSYMTFESNSSNMNKGGSGSPSCSVMP